jgi:hypothetical protein
MPHFPSRRRLAQVALPTMICAALVAGAARARSARPGDDAMPLEVAQADTTSPAPLGPMPGGEAGRGPHMHPGWGMGWTEHREAWAAQHRLRLADRLATMHVYLDIAPAQEDAWHGFSQAVLAMVPDPKDMPSPGPDAGHPPMGAFEGIDRMAKMMQRRADAARTVDQAAQRLKAVMTPAQVQKADGAWAAMREHWMHGHDHGWREHEWHDHGDHDHGDHDHGMDDR